MSTNPTPRPNLMLDVKENEVYVLYSVQALIKTKCQMDFRMYPFDIQTCYLEMFSLDNQVTFDPICVSEIKQVLEFELDLHTLHENVSVEVASRNGFTKQGKIYWIQFRQMNMDHLLNNPYVNEVTLRGQNPPLNYT